MKEHDAQCHHSSTNDTFYKAINFNSEVLYIKHSKVKKGSATPFNRCSVQFSLELTWTSLQPSSISDEWYVKVKSQSFCLFVLCSCPFLSAVATVVFSCSDVFTLHVRICEHSI